ncbi:MAG: hypothetical protein GWN82_15055, partial [Gemmatimonadetes bacterium]|nr:hypothetical protein [Gemmatimonadota bacterium]NIU31975.1 hypothetical protein [Gemmatimonadota bacterium]NIV62351.1 hypothetical protein [Gemmatimonadota bacterium]
MDLDGSPYLRMRVTSVLDDVELSAALSIPDSLRVIDVEGTEEADETPGSLELVEIDDGIYQVPEVRGGFAPLVVAFDSFSVVIDA